MRFWTRPVIEAESGGHMPSSWDGREENHSSPHYVLTVWPNGKCVLTTPSTVDAETFENVSRIVQRWLVADDNYPLIIGDCVVQMQAVPIQEMTVVQQVRL